MTAFPANSLETASFRSPGAEPRIAPFWFWNCAMEPERVKTQVRQMAEAGIGGFFIHPRQGLTLPYLSAEWFARVRAAVEAATEHGLKAWLYDEYPYPSGIAGGLVTANHPEFRARELNQSVIEANGGVLVRRDFPLGRIVSALACPIENDKVLWDDGIDVREHFGVVLTREQFWLWPMGHIPYNQKRFMADEGRLVLHWTPPAGEWKIFVGIETEQRDFKYYDCFVDPLAPGAVQEFIRLTHEPYAKHLGEYFGNTIPGIFTDEIEPALWSPEIEKACALDWQQVLPALRHDDHPRAGEVRYHLRECALRLFQERWENPIAEWCKKHNLIWGAEKPTWRPSQFWDVAEPATDAGHRRVGGPPETLTAELRANHRAAMAAAEQCGTEIVRCECFHSLGWGATLQDQKWQFDWMTAQGVNRFTPHAFYATSAGLKKHDAAPSFFSENPYWKHFSLLSEYAARLSYATSCGREVARIAVLHPTRALWQGGETASVTRKTYETLMNALLAAHHVFHPTDALFFQRASAINGGMELGHARYEVLIVPALPVVDEETESAMRAAREAGLTVLSGEANEILKTLDTRRKLSVADEAGNEIEGVWALWREANAQQILFLCNTGGEAVSTHVTIEANAFSWQRWDLEDGSIENYPAQTAGGKSRMSVSLAAYDSILLVGDQAAAASSVVEQPIPDKVLLLPTEGLWDLKLDRPNALRLNRWEIFCGDGDWSRIQNDEERWTPTEALPIRYEDRSQKRWMEACRREPGAPVWYRRHVACEFVPEDLKLLVEDGAILGEWSLLVNGVLLPCEAFAPMEFHGSDKTACAVAEYFTRGENVIALRVDNAPEMGGLQTPLHLIGCFALAGKEQRTLIPPPKTALFNDLVSAGLPHFSGTATYSKTFRKVFANQAWRGVTRIELPHGFAEIAEMQLNGRVLGARAWSPYGWQSPAPLAENVAQDVEVQIAVTNTLLPFIEGQMWDAAAQKFHRV